MSAVSEAAAPASAPGDRRATVERLRAALTHMFGAERRLRGRDHSRPGELTFGQLRTIAALGRQPEMTAGQLARSADLTPATVTVILDQLEAAHIIQRHRSTTDRRVCNVSLTPEGWELLERKLASWNGIWEVRLAEFDDQDLATAVAVVQRITGLLDDVNTKLHVTTSDTEQES